MYGHMICSKREAELRSVLRSARLMLYAWKAARQNMGMQDNHNELNNTITEIERVLEK